MRTSGRRWIRRLREYLPRGQSLSEDVWRTRHHTLSCILRAHVAAVFVFALARGYSWVDATLYAGVIATFAFLSTTDARHRKFASAMNAVGLVTCSAVLVDLSGGLIEMHFHFFVVVGILTLYQDWLPFLLAIAFVVLHHAVLGVLDPTAVYNHESAVSHPFEWALIHGAFVLAASVTSIVAWRLNEEQAFRDALTRLPNRTLFQDRVAHALARADRRPALMAVLFIDLDGFKDVNDSLGHAAGDQLLCNVAERLRASLRPADTAARLGGDEFAVLVEDLTNQADVSAIAERLLGALAVPFVVMGREIRLTASIGVALNAPSDNVDELLRNADVAMYTVKASGRGRCEVFVPEMHTAVVDRVELGHEVRRACELGEFVLHYQPVVHLESGQLSGLEALIRWQHPSRGLLPPSEFLDVAEATGAIVPLGAWAIREACAQARRWKDMLGGASIRVGVNLSPTQMLQPGLARTVASALATSGLDPAELVLELTEAVMIEDTSGAIERLRELDALGVLLAIDDFGTGFSSLNYVRQLPFRMIKIDKSFIDDVSESVHDAALVRAIVELGRALDVTTVAEGVETADQMLALRELGCDRAQGYYFSHPLPPAEVEALFVHAGERVPVFPSIGRAPVLETPPRADEPVLAGAVA